MTAPTIRPARDSDSAAVIAVIGSTWAEYADRGVVFDVDAELPELRAPASRAAAAGGAFHVVELDGQVVATVAWAPLEDGTVELQKLYVAAAARRLGLGGRLCALVESAARGRGAPAVTLWTDTRFADAHRLYERRQYRRIGQRVLDDLSRSHEYLYRLVF